MPRSVAAALVTLAALTARIADGAEPGTPPAPPPDAPGSALPPTDPAWVFDAEPSIWYVALGGDLRLAGSGGSPSEIRFDDLDIDSPRITPLAEVSARRGDWRVGVSGFAFSIDADATIPSTVQVGDLSLAAGDRVSSSFDMDSIEAVVGYRVVDHRAVPRPGGGHRLTVTLDLLAGARADFIDASVTASTGASTGSDYVFVRPVAGAKGTLRIVETFEIDVHIAAGAWPGGDHSSASFDVIVGGRWHATDHLAVQIGYRLYRVMLSDGEGPGEFEMDGSLAGLYGGIALRF